MVLRDIMFLPALIGRLGDSAVRATLAAQFFRALLQLVGWASAVFPPGERCGEFVVDDWLSRGCGGGFSWRRRRFSPISRNCRKNVLFGRRAQDGAAAAVCFGGGLAAAVTGVGFPAIRGLWGRPRTY